MTLGSPRVHYRRCDSTNARLRDLALTGAPHGTLITASEQTSGRGRQGRTWTAPPGQALLCSLLLRRFPRLLSLAAGVAVAEICETVARRAELKWPNDVLVEGRKVAGILVEGRPQEGWAVLGIGLNISVNPDRLPPDLRDSAGSLNLPPAQLEPVLTGLLERLEVWLAANDAATLAAVSERDALKGRPIVWATGHGTAAGLDADGRLLVTTASGTAALDAGEVHLTSPTDPRYQPSGAP
jgi:BirA family biotin operon repressor/biotin-[acetyl-CoA-carboxylase] ligase